MIYRTIMLRDMLEEIGEEKTNDILSDFSCPLDEDIENYMKNKAIGFEKAGISRTYLIYAIVDNESKFVGIYSLSQKPLFYDRDLSKKDKKIFYGTTYSVSTGVACDPLMNKGERYVHSILLGQLSKNYTDGNDRYITGDLLINLVFHRIIEWYKLSGGVTVHLDCRDNENLKSFYSKHGFNYYMKRDAGDTEFLIYVMPIKSIVRYVNEKEHTDIEKRCITALRKADFKGVIKRDNKGRIRKPTV